MNGASRTATRTSEPTSTNSLNAVQRVLLGIFLVTLAILIARLLNPFPLPMSDGYWEATVLILALVTTSTSMLRQLPMQNVLLAAVIIGAIGGGIQAVGVLTGIPFGPFVYAPDNGPQLFNTLPWFVPVIWIIFILNSRGVARLILRPWRKLRIYGFWLIGITAALTLVLDLGWEPFATHARHYVLWQPTKLPFDWCGVPITNFLGWIVTTLLILAFSTPALMKRKPKKTGRDYHSLIVWISLSLLFIVGAASQHLWTAVFVSAAGAVAVIPFALRGAKW